MMINNVERTIILSFARDREPGNGEQQSSPGQFTAIYLMKYKKPWGELILFVFRLLIHSARNEIEIHCRQTVVNVSVK